MKPGRQTVLRRTFLKAASLLAPTLNACSPGNPADDAAGRIEQTGECTLILAGQTLLHENSDDLNWPARASFRDWFGRADAVISNLETAIAEEAMTLRTRHGKLLHVSDATILPGLRALGLSFVCTANNHAWDAGTPGVLSTLSALDQYGIQHAGSGIDLAHASALNWQATPHGMVGIVAAAAGAIRDGAAASATRPGVYELRRNADKTLNDDDTSRLLYNIHLAATMPGNNSLQRIVLASLHNHYWEEDQTQTPQWQRALGRQCIDAGAAVFFAHGTPLLQGIEHYKRGWMFHGTGNFIFQTRKPDSCYDDDHFASVVTEMTFRDGQLLEAKATPVQLNRLRCNAASDLVCGLPDFADTRQAHHIGRKLCRLSAQMGTTLRAAENGIIRFP